MITAQTAVIVAMIGLLGGVFGAIISYIALKSSAKITATPDLIRVYGERMDKMEKEIAELKMKIEAMQEEVDLWEGLYFQLRKWLEAFFRKNGIKEIIPEFHKEATEA